MSKKIYTLVLGIILIEAMTHGAFAASRVFNGSMGTDWGTPANWGGSLPGTADLAFIRDGLTVEVNSDVGTIIRFYVGDNATTYPPGTGTLIISPGGKLICSDSDTYVGRIVSGAIGNVSISGGILQVGDTTGSGRLQLGVDSSGNNPAGNITISGGTVVGKFLIGSSGITGATADKLRIEGDEAVIRSTATTGNGVEARQSGIIEWVFNSTGISKLDYAGLAGSFNAGTRLVVDMANYTGGPAIFTLLDCSSFSGTPDITVTNAKPGTTYNWDAAAGDFTVTTTYSPVRCSLVVIQ